MSRPASKLASTAAPQLTADSGTPGAPDSAPAASGQDRARETRRRLLPQISLRGLLIGTVAAGVLAGLGGPGAVRVVRAWVIRATTTAPPPPPAGFAGGPPTGPALGTAAENSGYYESAESPLR